MKPLRQFVCVALVLAVVAPATAWARVVDIETTVALPDHSDQAIEGALEHALDTCVRGATAMGLASIWLDRALVLTDKVVVKMTASDEDVDHRQVKEMDLMPSVVSF
jgi:hypothetical protein